MLTRTKPRLILLALTPAVAPTRFLDMILTLCNDSFQTDDTLYILKSVDIFGTLVRHASVTIHGTHSLKASHNVHDTHG